MRILVINGSPKGKNSVTLQTVNYLQILHPEHTFDVLHAGQQIKALERDFSPRRTPKRYAYGRLKNSAKVLSLHACGKR